MSRTSSWAVVLVCVSITVAAGCDRDRRPPPEKKAAQVAPVDELPVTPEELADLAGVVERDCAAAPHHDDPRLQRALDPRSLVWASDASVPVQDRVQRFAASTDGVRRLIKGYLRCGDAPAFLASAAFELELEAEGLPVLDVFLATVPADDPSRPARHEGRQQMIVGAGDMIRGSAMVLRDLAGREPGVATALAQRLGAVAARLRPEGAPIEGAITTLRSLIDGETDPGRRAVLQTMLDAATATPPPAL